MRNREFDELRNMLIERDKPLLWEVLKASIIESNNLNTTLIRSYWHNIHLPQYLQLTYKDSDI